jgi:hypothetical protein
MLTNRQPSALISLIASLTLIFSSEYAKVAANIHRFGCLSFMLTSGCLRGIIILEEMACQVSGVFLMAESEVHSREDAQRMREAGSDAPLVWTALTI